jgi:hypothetical protein
MTILITDHAPALRAVPSFFRDGRLHAAILFLVTALTVALVHPYPTEFDERAHLSYAAAEAARPQLFPDLSTYRLLDADRVQWSGESNYLNHPSPYYLALGALRNVGFGVTALRLVNVALVAGALWLIVLAGFRLFGDPLQRAIFALAAVSFPRTAPIAGMINNDNLALLAAAMVFSGSVPGGSILFVAGGLALAGWTKLTALVGLGLAVGVQRLLRLRRGDRLLSREHGVLALGALCGLLPYLANLLIHGHLLYWNAAFVEVAPADRILLDVPQYLEAFAIIFAQRWPSDETFYAETVLPPLIAAAFLVGTVALGWWKTRETPLATAYLSAFVAMLLVHVVFGWRFYETYGNISTPEPRYYAVLWPGVAVALAGAIDLFSTRWRTSGAAFVLAQVLFPTMLGVGLIGRLIGAA